MSHDHAGHSTHSKDDEHAGHKHPYALLVLNLLLSFIAMYLLMYVMIDTWSDFFHNLNMGYMALTMLAPMAAIMLATMPGMYTNRRLNLAIYLAAAVVFLLAYGGIRTQTPIGDKQFIASMIPHHSGAILMCREAELTDPELRELCAAIQDGQREEIESMRAILGRL